MSVISEPVHCVRLSKKRAAPARPSTTVSAFETRLRPLGRRAIQRSSRRPPRPECAARSSNNLLAFVALVRAAAARSNDLDPNLSSPTLRDPLLCAVTRRRGEQWLDRDRRELFKRWRLARRGAGLTR